MTWPEELQQLLDDIGTVEGLDVMCLVSRKPSEAWRIDHLSDELALDRSMIEDSIRRLVGKGLLERLADGTLRPALPPERSTTLSALNQLCEQDRANVIGAIAHLSIGRIRSSAVRTFVRRSRDRNVG